LGKTKANGKVRFAILTILSFYILLRVLVYFPTVHH
jgi:hypothetical protein